MHNELLNLLAFDPATWLIVFLRISALFAVFPLFTMQNIPVQVRLALGALVACLITPALPAPLRMPGQLTGVVLLMLKEIGVGLLLGFVARIVFYMLEFAGNVVASELGMNWGAGFNPFSSTRTEAPGLALFYLGAIIFFALNLHHWLVLALQRSYGVLPINGAHLGPNLFADIVGRTNQLFLAGLLIAAPVIAVSFLINLVFSVIGRALPQMNVFVESFSFRALAGLAVFGLTLNIAAQHAGNYLRRLPDDLVRVAALLGGA